MRELSAEKGRNPTVAAAVRNGPTGAGGQGRYSGLTGPPFLGQKA